MKAIIIERHRSIRLVLSHALSGSLSAERTGHRAWGDGLCHKLIAAALLLSPAMLQSNPTGGQVISGQGGISQSGATTTITQSSANLSLDWQTFNIAPQETVNFLQPSATAIAVNRIFDNNGTQILGHLNANGQIYLINPNGVLFGHGAQVDVGGLVASTLDLNNASLSGSSRSFSGNGAGSIVNQGTINANNGGYVALLGNSVSNQGLISAQLGAVALGGGSAETLTFSGDSLVHLQVDRSALNSLAENGGILRAGGGIVVMTAGAANALLASVVNNTGVIEARTVENHDGTILLQGGATAGTVNVGGTLDASGTGAGQTGGTVHVLGGDVGLFDAQITVAGNAGGGMVLVGGDLHGANAAVPNASATYMSPDSTIAADAIANGNGGEVVLWSADSTRAYGSITARGGAQGGNGGLIETSGHWLDVTGIGINAGAANGKDGMWLLDPADVTITSSTSNGSFSGGEPDVFSPDPGATSADVNSATIVTALNAGSDVTITTANTGGGGSGDIDVTAAITWTAVGTPTTLTLNAIQDVIVGAAITATNGNLVAIAGRDVDVNAAVTATNGNFTSTAANNVNVNAAITTVTGNYSANAGVNVNVAAAITTTTGNVVLQAGNDGTGPGAAAGTVIFTAPGTVTLNTGTASIYYNPTTYATPTDYTSDFTGDGTVNSYMWVFAQGNSKVYNGQTAASLSFVGDPTVSGANAVSLTPGTANFATSNAGVAQTITYSGYSLGGADANAFALFPGAGTTTGTITPALLTVSTGNVTKTYNGTLAAIGSAVVTYGTLYANASNGGALDALSGGTFAFANANAGTGNKVVNVSGITVNDGNSGGNYIVTQANNTASTITPALLTVSTGNVTKTYNGTVAALGSAVVTHGTLYANASNGGALDALSGGSFAFANANAGSGNKVVDVSGITVKDGNGGGNYMLTQANNTTSTITPALLTVSTCNVTKTYNGTVAALGSAVVTHGTLYANASNGGALDALSGGSFAFANANVGSGNKVVDVSGITVKDGNGGGNYILTQANNTTSTITPALLDVIGITADNKVYNATTAATLAGTATVDAFGKDVVSVHGTGIGTFATKNVGTGIAVAVTGYTLSGANAYDYTIVQPTGVKATITPARLYVTGITADNKVYNATTAATLAGVATVDALGTDVVSVHGTGIGTFATKNVGCGLAVAVTGYTLYGASAYDYTIVQPTAVEAAITPALLYVTGITAENKVYNGTTAATLAGIATVDALGNDVIFVRGKGIGTFATKNVGTGIAVAVTGYTLCGGDDFDYTIVEPTAVANITSGVVAK